MERPRIRWRNVGRLAAGLGAGGLLVGVVPGMLEPAGPPPLPPDVGLAAAPSPAVATASLRRDDDERPPDPRDPPPRPPEIDKAVALDDPGPQPARDLPQAAATPPAPAPLPAPVPVDPPPPPPVVEPVPEPPEPAPEPPPEPEPPSGPSPFGFER